MKTAWWPLLVTCNGCKNIVPIVGVQYAADGELKIIAICEDCKAMVHLKVYASHLVHAALLQDIRRVAPQPLKIAAPAFSEQDVQELKDFHISMPEDS